MLSPLLIHTSVLNHFQTLLKADRLGHAYLFSGPPGVGKFETALAIAKLVNCTRPDPAVESFCDRCPSCRRVNNRSHPDLHILESERGQTIKIGDIRELLTHTQLKPFEAAKKLFIIRRSENFTLEAANAFLKTLEEPSTNTLMLLTTAVPEKNLATIKSRCHAVYFSVLPSKRLAHYLINDYHIKEAEADFLATFCEGSYGKARQLWDEKFLLRRNEIVANLIFSRQGEQYLKKISSDAEQTREALEVLLTWFRDVLFLKAAEGTGRWIHADRIHDLEKTARRFSMPDIYGIIAEIVKTLKLLNENLNVKIALTLLQEKIWVRS